MDAQKIFELHNNVEVTELWPLFNVNFINIDS